MRRKWKYDEDEEEDNDVEEGEEYTGGKRSYRRYSSRGYYEDDRAVRRYKAPSFETSEEEKESLKAHRERLDRFDEIEPLIRAGKYRPKSSDPWNAHLLYNLLKESGEI